MNKLRPPSVILVNEVTAPQHVAAGKPIGSTDSSRSGTFFFVNYSAEQGLSSNFISSSATDQIGNLWFASAGGGVSKYDGRSFTNYSKSQGLGSNVVFSIFPDETGTIWFGTSSGLSKYDGHGFRNYTTTDGLPSTYVMSIMRDRKKNLWIGTRERGLTKYDGNSFTHLYADNPQSDSYVKCILEDSRGDLWFGTEAGGVTRYDGRHFTNYSTSSGLAGNDVQCMMQDNAQNLWFGTSTGLTKFDGKNFTNYNRAQGLPDDNVSCMLQDKTGEIWIGTTSRGLSKYDGRRFKNYSIAQGFPNNNVSSLLEDRNGYIWVTSSGGGVAKWLGNCVSQYTVADGLTGSMFFSISQDAKNNVWFATKESGAIRYDGRVFERITRAQGLSSNNLWKVMSDKAGNIWFGTDDMGVCKWDGKYFTNYTTSQGLINNTVWCMCQDDSGHLWFGTNGGLSQFDGHRFVNYTHAQGVPDNNIQCVASAKSSQIWIGTHDDGVSVYDGKGFTNYSTADGLASNTVYSVIQDKYGNVWFGTNNGVSKFDGVDFTNYTTAEGLADNNVWSIAEDSARGIVWFATTQGISGIHYDSTKNANSKTGRFENFNQRAGYPIGDLSRSLFLDKKGILWAGSGNGKVLRFDYSLVKRNAVVPNLEVTSVQINNENICWNSLIKKGKSNSSDDSLALMNEMIMLYGKVIPSEALDSIRKKYRDIQMGGIRMDYPVPVNLVLPYKYNSISIDFVAVDPDEPNRIKYQYQLEGYSKDWSPLTSYPRAVFGNIPEGAYSLKLRAVNAETIVSQAEYKFTILAPWQRSWWAYLLYIMFFSGIIWVIVNARSRVLKRENRMLEEKVDLRTTELQQSLRELKSTQSQLVQREKMASLGELTAGIAHEIQNPLNFMNNFSEVNAELLTDMKRAVELGNFEEAKSIASDILNNEQKINHHGRRADAIVKSMLQHFRKSAGRKELADINQLAEEYLRLAFHGMKAKEQNFNVKIETELDDQVGKINVVPQDIGSVLLNLYNNAFYAVLEKKKNHPDGYQPMVSVLTKRNDHFVDLIVKDNGSGISPTNLEKIFQPFFTTKPTGQATGLGLSLSYDIIKAHGGEIRVMTRENEGSEFIVELPTA